MKTKNELLTDEQLEIIEAAVDYVLYTRNKGYKNTLRATIGTALAKWSAYNKISSKCIQGWIGARELRYLIDLPLTSPLKFCQTYECGNWRFVDIKEAKEIVKKHYTRPIVWRPAETMPPANCQTPSIYAIVDGDKIERINMCEFVDLPASMPELVWNFVCKMHKIKFWAYPKDILPNDDERGTTGTAL